MLTNQSTVLKAKYVFHSEKTGNTYVLNVTTNQLTNPIPTLDNPNCVGYSIINGTFTQVASDGTTNTYPVPGGQTPFIYNGLWVNAADSPDGTGSPWCNGIDRLFINFTQQSNNTLICAIDGSNISVVFGTGNDDTAQLIQSNFPPTS
jgi:hypothetical protein